MIGTGLSPVDHADPGPVDAIAEVVSLDGHRRGWITAGSAEFATVSRGSTTGAFIAVLPAATVLRPGMRVVVLPIFELEG